MKTPNYNNELNDIKEIFNWNKEKWNEVKLKINKYLIIF